MRPCAVPASFRSRYLSPFACIALLLYRYYIYRYYFCLFLLSSLCYSVSYCLWYLSLLHLPLLHLPLLLLSLLLMSLLLLSLFACIACGSAGSLLVRCWFLSICSNASQCSGFTLPCPAALHPCASLAGCCLLSVLLSVLLPVLLSAAAPALHSIEFPGIDSPGLYPCSAAFAW